MTELPDGYRATLVVGMEVHVELATRSKMWTSAPNVAHRDYFEAAPNTLLSPVVIGMPGTLPVMNKAAVEMSIQVGLALHCTIADRCKWDRKSYYYPDLPKNYQISQYDQPLCYDGALDIPIDTPASEEQSGQDRDTGDSRSNGDFPNFHTRRIGIIRAHLEEDAGKLLHELPGGGYSDGSLVDLNRAGTPLLEIVTQPDLRSADEAVAFGQTLRDICRHLGVTEGIMQKGHMRFEPNINVVIEDADGKLHKTPIVEIKNLNSFRALHGAISHEYRRQIDEWLETKREMGAGEKSTRGWDDVKMVTVLQREKEDAHDYRYFPDPDLVGVAADEAMVERLRADMPELPMAKLDRYLNEVGLSDADAKQLVDEPTLCRFYEQVAELTGEPRRSAAILLNQGMQLANARETSIDRCGFSAQQAADVLKLSMDDKINNQAVGRLLEMCCDTDEDAATLAEREGLLQVSDDSALEGWVDQVLADQKNAKIVEDIKGGKDKAIGALLGQIMKLSKGQANPKAVREIILSKVRS
jgi:aspartyl-tRNA(Asn)/glutamyl-tRNA(Gln) amidotransferase subunit B